MYKLHKSEFDKMPSILALNCIFLALSGCNDAAKTGPGFGEEKFTFQGELPENFGLTAIIGYYPLEPDRAECQEEAWFGSPNKFVIRRSGKKKVIPINKQAQSFSFNVPLKHSEENCQMAIESFDLQIKARFGEQEWQTSYDQGGFRFLDDTLDTPTPPQASNTAIKAECTWLFQESKLQLALAKLLTCKGATTKTTKKNLLNGTFHFAVKVNPEEKPYIEDTWIKLDNGWKPCLPTPKGSILCQKPPKFKTFEMNGKTCTIYPGCTE